MGTAVQVNVHAYATTHVATNLIRSLKQLVVGCGLDATKLLGDWQVLERGVATWLASRHLERLTLEIYSNRTDKLVRRFDFDIDYGYNPNGNGFCFVAEDCPNGDGDCPDDFERCIATPFGPKCLEVNVSTCNPGPCETLFPLMGGGGQGGGGRVDEDRGQGPRARVDPRQLGQPGVHRAGDDVGPAGGAPGVHSQPVLRRRAR